MKNQRKPWWSLLVVAAISLAACSETSGPGDNTGNEIAQCVMTETGGIEWNESAVGHEDIGAFVDGYAREFPTAMLGNEHVVVKIERRTTKPLIEHYSNCPDRVQLPLHITITRDEDSWESDFMASVSEDDASNISMTVEIEDTSFFEEIQPKPEVDGEITGVFLVLNSVNSRIDVGTVYLNAESKSGDEKDGSVSGVNAQWMILDISGCSDSINVPWEDLTEKATEWWNTYKGSYDNATIDGKEGVITISQGDGEATQSRLEMDMCFDKTTLPIRVSFTVDENTWAKETFLHLEDAQEVKLTDVYDDWEGLEVLKDPESLVSSDKEFVRSVTLELSIHDDQHLSGRFTAMIETKGASPNESGGAEPKTLFEFSTPAR